MSVSSTPLVSKLPQEGSPSFRDDASAVWAEMGLFTSALQVTIPEINTAITEINGYSNSALASKGSALVSETNALNYMKTAEIYRDEVLGYIVPTNATLSPDAINALVDAHRLENFLGFNF